MRLGITATRAGLTRAQIDVLSERFNRDPSEVHHGDCVGGDAEAHTLAIEAGCRVVLHPPTQDGARAWCQGAVLVHKPLPFLVRDHRIVDATEALIALPRNETGEELRSGTWATVRYARKQNRLIAIVRPSGRVEFEPRRSSSAQASQTHRRGRQE